MEKKKVMVGMSGGVDSSAAALLLLEQGYEVAGLTFELWDGSDGTCGTKRDVQDASDVCAQLGIPHYVVDFRQQFRETVMRKFVHGYCSGITPNPCVECNRTIKFSAFLDKALELGYDLIATGHYARVERDPDTGRYRLMMAEDAKKDQSYVLYSLTQRQLSHMVLPLYGYKKEELRERARQHGLKVHAKAESQDICFIPDGNFCGFIEKAVGHPAPEGNFVDTQGNVIGTHSGIWHYTIGQRKGLGTGFGQKMFVCGIDAASNEVMLTSGEGLFRSELTAQDVNLIELEALDGPVAVEAKIRYAAKPAPAVLFPLEDGRVKVQFEQPQRAITPGQAVVFYRGNCVFGGGTIASF